MLADLLQEMSYPELEGLIDNLRRLLRNHEKWMAEMNRAIICGTEVDQAFVEPDTHRRCEFGAWLQSVKSPAILQDREFTSLGAAHRQLHDGMHALIQQHQERRAITEQLYDSVAALSKTFNNAAWRFLQHLESVQQQFDPLTKLLSHKAMHYVLEGELSRIRRVERSTCLALAEVEQIRTLHGNHAFEQADRVLVSLARLFLGNLRKYDTVARYGDSQFIFCLPETGVAETAIILERINASVENASFTAKNDGLQTTCLFAMAELDITLNVRQSITNVDKALEESRRFGGRTMITHINLHPMR